ncbi:MAG: rhomboid family intramembrane serine protease [Bacteroidales bacterium]
MNTETKRIVYAAYYPLIFVALMWLVKLVESGSNLDLSDYGNYPLSLEHLYGIFTQPLIHGDWMHLWSNTMPLLFLIWSLFYFYGDIAFKIFPWIWVGSGLLTWLIGRPSFHIGASGMVYGIAFFLFTSGILRRMRTLMALSGIVALSYGSFVWNMFPIAEIWKPELSWEGHLSGAIAGVFLAILYRKLPPQKPVEPETEEIDDADEPSYWLDSRDDDLKKS